MQQAQADLATPVIQPDQVNGLCWEIGVANQRPAAEWIGMLLVESETTATATGVLRRLLTIHKACVRMDWWSRLEPRT
jgi:hypothetical protein